MEVNRISANIRYSQDIGKGAWKVIKLGAEASISDERTSAELFEFGVDCLVRRQQLATHLC